MCDPSRMHQAPHACFGQSGILRQSAFIGRIRARNSPCEREFRAPNATAPGVLAKTSLGFHRQPPDPRSRSPPMNFSAACGITPGRSRPPSTPAFTIGAGEQRQRASRVAEGRLRGGAQVHPLPAAPDADDGRVRRRERRCRADVHRRGARGERGPAGPAVRRPGGQAARQAARRDRARPPGRVHREHAQMPPAGQPRPASERDRGLL